MDSGDNENVMKHGHPQALEAAIDMSVKKCLSANRLSDYAKCLPKVLKNNPTALKAIFEDYTQQVSKSIKDNINDICANEVTITEHLNTLENMSSTARPPTYKAWRPTNIPSDTLEDHLISTKKMQLERLLKVAEQLEAQNRKLEDDLRKQRAVIQQDSQEIQQRKMILTKNLAV